MEKFPNVESFLKPRLIGRHAYLKFQFQLQYIAHILQHNCKSSHQLFWRVAGRGKSSNEERNELWLLFELLLPPPSCQCFIITIILIILIKMLYFLRKYWSYDITLFSLTIFEKEIVRRKSNMLIFYSSSIKTCHQDRGEGRKGCDHVKV